MGGQPWMYFVPYKRNVQAALDLLKARELRAGRYNPAMRELPFPVLDVSPAPGGRHDTIESAREAAGADGTRSILDMDRVVAKPRPRRLDETAAFAAFQKAQRGDVFDADMFVAMGGMPGPDDFGTVAPLAPEILQELYGTTRPAREAVEAAPRFFDDIERGMGVYIVLYDEGEPLEICFAGYSYD